MINSLQTISDPLLSPSIIENKFDFIDDNLRIDNTRSPTQYVSTLNSQGYMLTDLNIISRAFVEYSPTASGPVLDIGAAYGYVVLEALQKGAKVIANDIDSRHLNDLCKRIPKGALDRVSLVLGRVPDEVNIGTNTLGAVHASGVLHYLSPFEFSKSIQQIYKWLKPGGKLFLATPSPYTNVYQNYLPIYKEHRKLNKEWPGYIVNVREILPECFSNIPKTAYLLNEEDIRLELEENGFEIERLELMAIKLPVEQFTEETNVIGVIAEKI